MGYEVVSPNKDFPAIPQAQLLRTMACVSIPEGNSAALPNFQHRELFTNGASCLLPGALNNLQGGGKAAFSTNNSNQEMYDTFSAAAKAYQYQMQQVAGNLPPTNANLPYPYNTMVFSVEGAERLEQILSTAVPDPLEVPSLLGSYAKIDADWNAYFNSAPPTTYDSTAAAAAAYHQSYAMPTPAPHTNNNNNNNMGPGGGSSGTLSAMAQNLHHQQLNGGHTGSSKVMGHSPDSVASLLSSNSTNSPANLYANNHPHQQQQQQQGHHQAMPPAYHQQQQQQHSRQYM